MAGVKAIDKSDPFLTWIDNDEAQVEKLSWWNDWAGTADIVDLCGIRLYSRDCYDIPGFLPDSRWAGYGAPETGTYEAFFGRLLQAMHTETSDNAMGWLGTILSDTRDTGTPPHAGKISGESHARMEKWLDRKKIDITGYKPCLLGKTDKEATEGCVKRLNDLHEYTLQRFNKLLPLAEANDRSAAEPLLLECANETARAVADILHTVGYLHSQMKPIPGTGALAGTIQAPRDPDRLTARIMLQGTKFSTLADLSGRYEFRNLPPGQYTAIVLMPRCKPQTFEVALDPDKRTTKDLALESTGNLLRNGDLSVRWARNDRPDGWRGVRDGQNAWLCRQELVYLGSGEAGFLSEPFFVKPRQRIELKVAWNKDAAAKVGIAVPGKPWDDKQFIDAHSDSLVVTLPDEKDINTAYVVIRSSGDPWKMIRSISVKAQSQTSGK
jgi:hypothetical protein